MASGVANSFSRITSAASMPNARACVAHMKTLRESELTGTQFGGTQGGESPGMSYLE